MKELVQIKENWRQIADTHRDRRTQSRILAHYLLEKELARRLMDSSPEERSHLYTQLYDELFTKLPDHPQLSRSGGPHEGIQEQVNLLKKLVHKNTRFAEFGAGDCRVSLGLAGDCRSVTAIDVTECVQFSGEKPSNFNFVKIDGRHLPFPEGSFDFVYSNQLMEHLHPDDALIQLNEIYRVLAPGGVYFCITPHAFTGPHDVSRYFDDAPTCFHLREYRYLELTRLLLAAGFSQTSIIWARRGAHIKVPSFIGVWIERLLEGPLGAMRHTLAANNKIQGLLGIMILGQKGVG